MKWGNYIKRTAIRRVVWILVGLLVYALLSLLGINNAHATYCGSNSCQWQDEGEAYSMCMVAAAARQAQRNAAGFTATDHRCVVNSLRRYTAQILDGATNPRWWGIGQVQVPPPHNAPLSELHNWPANQNCSNRQDSQMNRNTTLWGPPPPQLCISGCTYGQNANADLCGLVEEGPTAGYWCNSIYSPTGGTCTGNDEDDPNAPPRECPAGEIRLPNGQCGPRGDCPVGMHEVNGECHPTGSCPVGQVKAPDGSCVTESCPAGQARGADGTCKADSNDDGTPDEDEEGGDGTNTDGMQFSGGESCEVPPTCSGDAIMCGQSRIQWRIDCNTRRNRTITGGNACHPSNVPICTGEKCDALEYVQLVNTWKAACALEAMAGGEGGPGGGMEGVESRLDGIASFLGGDGNCLASPEGCGPGDGDLWDDEAPEWSEWQSGLSSTGSCPAPVSTTISLGGYSTAIEFSYQPICDFAALMRWVLIAAATIMSGFIVAGVRNS